MTKFYVSLHLEVEADNVDEARAIGYDIYSYGHSDALDNSDDAEILNYKVEVGEE